MAILIFPLILIMGYFLLVRPQQTQARRARALVQNLQLGSEVQTAGGIVGRVVDLDDQYVQLQVGPGTTITFVRSAVAKLLSGAEGPDGGMSASASGPPTGPPVSPGEPMPSAPSGVFVPEPDPEVIELPSSPPEADPGPQAEEGPSAP
jgi:preprotein translocase subunit YajC